jgi:effector-binding domain-containing protein
VPADTSSAEISTVFSQAFARLYGFLAESVVQPAGPPLARYASEEFTPTDIGVQVAVPVGGPLAGKGEIHSEVIPAGPVAVALHRGPYDRIDDAYRALGAWIANQGLDTLEPPEEVYLVGPDRAPPSQLRTEVRWPLDTT